MLTAHQPSPLRQALVWLALRLLPTGVYAKNVSVTITRIEVP